MSIRVYDPSFTPLYPQRLRFPRGHYFEIHSPITTPEITRVMALTLQPIRGFPPYSDFFLRAGGWGGLYTGDRDEQSKTRESPLTL